MQAGSAQGKAVKLFELGPGAQIKVSKWASGVAGVGWDGFMHRGDPWTLECSAGHGAADGQGCLECHGQCCTMRSRTEAVMKKYRRKRCCQARNEQLGS